MRAPATESEAAVERDFTERGKRCGAEVLKFTSPGNSGVPDRIVLFPDGSCCFAEIKAPGEKPRPLQRRIFGRFARLGHPVTIIDTKIKSQLFWARNAWRLNGGEEL